MTIAATATTNFSVDELVTLAFKLNGFGPHDPSAGDLALGKQVLFLGLQSLANDGIVLRASDRITLTTTPGVAYVDAPADTQTIEKGGVIRDTNGNDVQITPFVAEAYLQTPVKTTEGMPTKYFPDQQADGTWRIYFWPVPTASFPTFIVPRTRRGRDVSTGNVTLDFDPKWHLAIVKFLQSNIARAKGRRDLAKELNLEYQDEREKASNNETDRGDGQFCVDASIWD